jgi:hypothetical protein
MAWQIRVAGLPEPVRELKFHPVRRWRADFAWPDHPIPPQVSFLAWPRIHSDGQNGTFANVGK